MDRRAFVKTAGCAAGAVLAGHEVVGSETSQVVPATAFEIIEAGGARNLVDGIPLARTVTALGGAITWTALCCAFEIVEADGSVRSIVANEKAGRLLGVLMPDFDVVKAGGFHMFEGGKRLLGLQSEPSPERDVSVLIYNLFSVGSCTSPSRCCKSSLNFRSGRCCRCVRFRRRTGKPGGLS